MAGEDKDFYVGSRTIALDEQAGLKSINVGSHQIQDYQVRAERVHSDNLDFWFIDQKMHYLEKLVIVKSDSYAY